MKSLLALPVLVGALLFSGCEATVVDSGPVHGHRYGYADRGDYYRGRPDYYDGNTYSRPRSDYYGRSRTVAYSGGYAYSRPRADYYQRSPSVQYSGGYARTRAPYRSGYNQDVVVNRTHVNRTNVTRKSAPCPPGVR